MTDEITIIEDTPVALADQPSARGLGCTISSVRDVFALGVGKWACRVDLTFDDGTVETVDYVADANDTMSTGQWVVARILAGHGGPVGTLADYEASQASKAEADWQALADADRKAELKAEAARLRWERETAGCSWNGRTVLTDRESQGKVSSLYQMARDGLVTEAKWKFADGSFATLTAAEIQAMGQAVAAHVQAAFDAEGDVAGEIDAGTITTKAAVSAAILGASA